jgi:hypothetical protein
MWCHKLAQVEGPTLLGLGRIDPPRVNSCRPPPLTISSVLYFSSSLSPTVSVFSDREHRLHQRKEKMAEFPATVSVIIPVKDCEPYLADTFQSILDQTYRHLQVCIYDDGSRDGSVAAIQAWLPRFQAAGFDAVFTTRPEAAITYGFLACTFSISL